MIITSINLLGGLLLVLSVLFDYLSKVNPIFGRVGVVVWYLSYFWLLVYLVSLISKIKIKQFPLYSIIVLLFFIGFVTASLGNGKYLAGETCLETACALDHLHHSSDWGYRQTCHLGYPARQFYIPALPSLFNLSLFNLNLGGSLYLFLGLIVFSFGVLTYFELTSFGDKLNAFFIAFLISTPNFLYLLSTFEQSLYPVCLTLITAGLFLLYLKNPKRSSLFAIGISSNFLLFSYTPAMSVFLLSLVVLLFLLFQKKIIVNRIQITIIIILSSLSLLSNLSIRTDIRLMSQNPDQNRLNLIVQTLIHTFIENSGTPFVNSLFQLIFVTVIISSITLYFGKKMFFCSLWIIATILISAISPGYASPPINFALHRALVVLPVLFLMIIYIFHRLQTHFPVFQHLNLNPIFLFLFFVGIFETYSYFSVINKSPRYEFIEYLNKANLSSYHQLTLINPPISLVPIKDFIVYFYPQMLVQTQDIKICQDTITFSGVYLIPEESSCDSIQNSPLLSAVKSYYDNESKQSFQVFIF